MTAIKVDSNKPADCGDSETFSGCCGQSEVSPYTEINNQTTARTERFIRLQLQIIESGQHDISKHPFQAG